jgi:hypothetical protein
VVVIGSNRNIELVLFFCYFVDAHCDFRLCGLQISMISGSLRIIEKGGMISMNSPQIFVDVKHVVVVNTGESFDAKFCL